MATCIRSKSGNQGTVTYKRHQFRRAEGDERGTLNRVCRCCGQTELTKPKCPTFGLTGNASQRRVKRRAEAKEIERQTQQTQIGTGFADQLAGRRYFGP